MADLISVFSNDNKEDKPQKTPVKTNFLFSSDEEDDDVIPKFGSGDKEP